MMWGRCGEKENDRYNICLHAYMFVIRGLSPPHPPPLSTLPVVSHVGWITPKNVVILRGKRGKTLLRLLNKD